MAAERIWPWEPIIGGAILLFVAPVLLALVVAFLRSNERLKRLLRHVTTIDPLPRAWDFAFKDRGGRFVRLKLRDGERVGGVYGERSFAAAYPEPEDIFLEEAWRLDEDGAFVEPVEGSGLLVLGESIELVELLSRQKGRADDQERQVR